jgi:RNA polymerase sigma factor (sigma-70 family)
MFAALMLGTALSALGGESRAEAHSEQALSDITRYCTACWRNARLAPDRWPDCTQEVFIRLLERLPREHWADVLQAEGEPRKEFLRAIDAVKKRTQRARTYAPLAPETGDDRLDSDRQRADLHDALTKAAPKLLSERQQRIVQMSLAGWSVGEMANALGTTADRVSDEKYKAVAKLRKHFA